MSHIAYIDPDEEIISVIGRLRKASDADVFLVVPRHALFMRSLVNLRLLDREAKKMKRHLSLVVPDAESQALAEKAGVESRTSLEGIPGAHLSPKASLPARIPQVQSGMSPSSDQKEGSVSSPVSRLHSESIGSSSFFVARGSEPDMAPQQSSPPAVQSVDPARVSGSISAPTTSRTVPVRDRTPKRLTALNSATSFSSPPPEASPSGVARDIAARDSNVAYRTPDTAPLSRMASDTASRVSFTFSAPETPLSPALSGSSSKAPNDQPASMPAPSSPAASPQGAVSSGVDQSALSRFYQKGVSAPSAGGKSLPKSTPNVSDTSKSGGHRVLRLVLFGGVALSLLAVTGVSLVIFVPRADVTVIAKEHSASLDAEITARVDQESVDTEKKYIPLRVVETEKDVSQSFPSTGQASVSDKRARGMVTISNAFGTSEQSLVATTRFESPNGKIFRLVKNVTVPGMKEQDGQSVPGTVDAEVVADSSGEEYNLESTTFTIPGLKGSSKYEKITASSSQSFEGGGGSDGEIASVSADDVARAKESTLKALPELLRDELEKDLQPGEKLLDDAILSETISSGAFPSVGAVASSFDFRAHVSVRALVFSESDIQTVAAALLGDGAKPEDIQVEYTVPHPDFTAKTLGVKVRVSFAKGQDMDIEQIKQSILGKSVGDVQAVFADYPDIQKIEVVFWPKFMTSRIPSRSSQVSVKVESVSSGVLP